MWKRYQAAHVCLEIAMRKGEEDFVAAELAREQHRVSRILASAVKEFWQSAEVAATKERGDGRGWGQMQAARRRGESEVVPMDVDFPAAREVSPDDACGSLGWSCRGRGGRKLYDRAVRLCVRRYGWGTRAGWGRAALDNDVLDVV